MSYPKLAIDAPKVEGTIIYVFASSTGDPARYPQLQRCVYDVAKGHYIGESSGCRYHFSHWFASYDDRGWINTHKEFAGYRVNGR